MFARKTLAAVVTAVAALSILPGCAVSRGQENVGEYISDAGITTAIKAKFVENKTVAALSIKVETLDGNVVLSGFAKSNDEKRVAEEIARASKGVKSVRNGIVVSPS